MISRLRDWKIINKEISVGMYNAHYNNYVSMHSLRSLRSLFVLFLEEHFLTSNSEEEKSISGKAADVITFLKKYTQLSGILNQKKVGFKLSSSNELKKFQLSNYEVFFFLQMS